MKQLPFKRNRYLSKKQWNDVIDNKQRNRKSLFFFFKDKTTYSMKTTAISQNVFDRGGFIFWLTLNYKLYALVCPVLNKNIINFKFLKRVAALYAKNLKNFIKIKNIIPAASLPSLFALSPLLTFYNYFFKNVYRDVFYFLKKSKKTKPFYKFIITFNRNKLFINFQNPLKENITALTTGLFIKFFNKKKSMKKSKTLKFLLMKQVRKLLLITRIKKLLLIAKKAPTLFLELINLLNQPIAHKFTNPFSGKSIEEGPSGFTIFKFSHFIFLRTTSFVKNKKKKKDE